MFVGVLVKLCEGWHSKKINKLNYKKTIEREGEGEEKERRKERLGKNKEEMREGYREKVRGEVGGRERQRGRTSFEFVFYVCSVFYSLCSTVYIIL